MNFLRKEVPVWFPGGQGSAGKPYRSIPSHFEPWVYEVAQDGGVHLLKASGLKNPFGALHWQVDCTTVTAIELYWYS